MIEKELKRYVVADVDRGDYLRTLGDGKYEFVSDISIATKTLNRKYGNMFMERFINASGYKPDLVLVPLKITYDLIKEGEVDG